MESRKIACLFAAGFIGVGLTATATAADAKPRQDRDVVVNAFNPETQRRVSYADLNLAVRPDQRVLVSRISTTASSLCRELNGVDWVDGCTRAAVRSTDDQVAAAIDRAQRKMAGLSVGPAIAITMVIGSR
jgi:UrcA family protein